MRLARGNAVKGRGVKLLAFTFARQNEPPADGGVSEAIRLGIVLAADVRYGELKRAGELLADPVEGIQSGAAAYIFAFHLPDHYLGIREDVKRLRFQVERVLQRFKQGGVLGHIVIVLPDPAGNPDLVSIGVLDHHPNTGRTRIPVRAAVHVGDEM